MPTVNALGRCLLNVLDPAMAVDRRVAVKHAPSVLKDRDGRRSFDWPRSTPTTQRVSRGKKTSDHTLSAKLIRHTSRHICGIGAWRLGFVASVSHVIPAATCNSLERKGNVCDKLRHENDLGHRTNTLILLERAKGIEPSTYSLGS